MGDHRADSLNRSRNNGFLAADGSQDAFFQVHGFCKACDSWDVDMKRVPHTDPKDHLHLGALCSALVTCSNCDASFHTNSRARDGAGSWHDLNDPTL